MQPSAARNLRADQRGAILITAVMMGAVLAAAVLYVLQVGDAIFVRERLQDAADATAFEAAVWHARGMNATAALNILMSAALAVLATIRQVELVCMVIPGAQSCATTMLNWENRVTPWVDNSLKVLQHMEVFVAVQAPVFAAAAAAEVPYNFDDDGAPEMRGTALSLALLPSAVDRLFDAAPRVTDSLPERLPAAILGDAGGIFPSLPLQKGSFSELCGEATSFLADQVSSLIDRFAGTIPGLDIITRFINNFFTGRIAGRLLEFAGDHLSGLMCRPARALLDQTIDSLANHACGAEEDERNERRADAEAWNLDHPDDQREVLPEWSTEEDQRCMDREEGEAREQERVRNLDSVPAAVYGLAKNGNPFLHVWSLVNEVVPDDSDSAGRQAVAEAEYYFDCDSTWDDGCNDDAMWRPGWTARMRRYRMPYDELDLGGFAYGRVMGALRARAGQFISAHLEASIENLLSDAACGGVSGGAATVCNSLTTRFVDPVTDWIKEKAEDFIGGRFPDGQSSVNNTAAAGAQGGAERGINRLIDLGIGEVTERLGEEGIAVPNTLGYRHDPRVH